MAFNTLCAETGLDMMGEDFFVTIEFRITSHGFKGSWDEQGFDPEFEIDKIILQREYWDDQTHKIEQGSEWVVDSGKLFDCLCETDRVYNACVEQIEQEEENDWREYDEDYYRDER